MTAYEYFSLKINNSRKSYSWMTQTLVLGGLTVSQLYLKIFRSVEIEH